MFHRLTLRSICVGLIFIITFYTLYVSVQGNQGNPASTSPPVLASANSPAINVPTHPSPNEEIERLEKAVKELERRLGEKEREMERLREDAVAVREEGQANLARLSEQQQRLVQPAGSQVLASCSVAADGELVRRCADGLFPWQVKSTHDRTVQGLPRHTDVGGVRYFGRPANASQHADSLAGLPQSTVPRRLDEAFFCPAAKANVAAWQEERVGLSWRAGGGEHRGFLTSAAHQEAARHPQWFCNKLAVNLAPWPLVTPRTRVTDVAIAIFTGDNIAYSRAVAVRDAWLHRFPNAILLAQSGDHNIPIVGMSERYPTLVSSRATAVQAMQLLAYRELLARFPTARWFYTVGCDTYVHADHLLRLLDEYDPDVDHWVAPASWPDSKGIPAGFDTSGYPRWTLGREDNTFHWMSGAFGWFLSHEAATTFDNALDAFMADPAIPAGCNCPDLLTGMLLSLLGYEPLYLRDKWERAMLAYAVDDKASRPDIVDEYLLYHYVTPRKMVAIDQRAAHEKLDRLLNAGSTSHLVAYAREVINERAAMQRRHQADLRYILEHPDAVRTTNFFDVPTDGPRTETTVHYRASQQPDGIDGVYPGSGVGHQSPWFSQWPSRGTLRPVNSISAKSTATATATAGRAAAASAAEATKAAAAAQVAAADEVAGDAIHSAASVSDLQLDKAISSFRYRPDHSV
uniref:N-acetylgalactosaminide beta-1,3-galactosyltransferase n=1 Tax=Sexangularia sp. CB-2014 TaxID=1486929 RepID=A0A7S1VF79_9EUKA